MNLAIRPAPTTPSQTREASLTVALQGPGASPSIMFPDSRVVKLGQPGTPLVTELLRIGTHGLVLGRVTSAGHEVDLLDPDHITLLVPHQGRIDICMQGQDYAFGAGGVVMVQPGARHTRVIAPPRRPFVATTLQVPIRRFPAAGPALRGANRLTSAMGQAVGQILPQLASDVFRKPDAILPDRVVAELASLIGDALADAVDPSQHRPRPRGGLRDHARVCLAEDIIQARADEALSITDLAQEMGITPRSLQLAFQHVHGLSPRQYLDQVRLRRARARLMAPGDAGSVTMIALDCGFLHLGRFAQTYARVFGERPSDTLARRQAG